MIDLRTKIGTLELENPIIISSGHVTLMQNLFRADQSGAGAIVMKSTLLENEYSQVVKPYAPGRFPDARMNFLPAGNGIIGVCGLSPEPLEKWADWIKENKKKLKTPLIGSYMAISLEGYIKGAKILQEAGVDAIEICLVCPLPYLNHYEYAGKKLMFNAQKVEEICTAVRKVVDIPLGAKVPLVSAVKKAGLNYVTLGTNFPGAPGVDLETIEPKVFCAIFQTGSSTGKHANLSYLRDNAEYMNTIHISAHGGCKSWEDVIECIFYGASSVQMHTVFMRKGFSIIEGFKANIKNYMERKGFKSLEEMKGIIYPKLLTYDEYISTFETTKGKIVVELDWDKCNDCGICVDTCIYGALTMIDGKLRTIEDKCEGCNLCVINCPEGAMRLKNTELIRKLVTSNL